jgi:sugar phosphate permease
MIRRTRPFGQRYAFVVAGVIFFSLLVSAGMRSTPGVLILPLESAFGWDRETVSLSASIGILLYGLMGPFAAALMQGIGIRRTLMGGLALMSAAAALSLLMEEPWQLVATWGVLSGLGTGSVALVLGATIVSRWFVTNRGLMMGLLTASTATGTLLFLPGLAAIAEAGGWQPVVVTVAIAAATLIPVVAWLLPERPQDAGLQPYGQPAGTKADIAPARANPIRIAFEGLFRASRHPTFWLLFGTFFVCGFTTNGLVGTHLIAMCGDQGIPEVQAAGLLALMGLFDLLGTTASGWLTDRVDSRKLLFAYYGLRGLALIYLPYSGFTAASLLFFAVFYGLDWIATVPPTLRLTTEAFGDRDAPIVFGWIAVGHQIGAASAAFLAGLSRSLEGRYLEAFVIAGTTALAAAFMALLIRRRPPAARTA